MTELPTSARQYEQTTTQRVPGLTRERKLPKWIDVCSEQLRAVSNLPNNWDSYGGYAANSLSLTHSHNFLVQLAKTVGVLQPSIALNACGYICFEWETDEWLITVEINHRGIASYYYEEGDAEVEGTDSGEYKAIIQLLTRH